MRSRLTLSINVALLLVCGGAAFELQAADKPQHKPLGTSRQVLLVVTDNWESHTGTLRRFERAKNKEWSAAGEPISVVVGRNGLAWGRGVHGSPGEGPVKREGDGKAPAGVFAIGPAFGHAAAPLRGLRLRYVDLAKGRMECVDDVKSTRYDRLVSRERTGKVDWDSSEKMWSEPLYKWGAVVEHNLAITEPGAGSCIFLHIWKGPESSTAGCTAMPEANLVETLRWLDPNKKPLLVQLPKAEYERLKTLWQLP